MGRAYSDITFTPSVRAMQSAMGSREQYAGFDQATDRQDRLRGREIAFIEQADHFFQATVSETGWPYVQHRGGPAGFLKVLDNKTLGFTDFSGNMQYISVGNLKKDDRISLILVDYAEQVRLKLIGRVRTVDTRDDPALIERLRTPGYNARIERAFIIDIEGYDWNCPQHITPRFTQAEIARMTAPLQAQLKRLKEQALAAAPPAQAAQLAAELGTGPLALIVSGVRQLTPDVRAYELRAADGSPLPRVTAGAHLAVPVLLSNGQAAVRNYSIASDPRRTDSYEIAVLREDGGAGGSAGAHAHFRLGLVLHCSLPRNDFELQAGSGPVLLIAGGIGITPIKSMAHALAAQGRAFELHYAVRSRQRAPFLGELAAQMDARLIVHAADEGGRLDPDALVRSAAADAVFYVCGPQRLIDAVRESVRRAGIDESRLRFERFAAVGADDDKPITVQLVRSGKTIQVAADQSILDAAEAAGVFAASSCRTGACGTCAVRVVDGVPEHRDTALTAWEKDEERMMCICVSRAAGESLAIDL